MKIKVQNIMATLDKHHRVIIKLDMASGMKMVTISEGKGQYIIGRTPAGSLRKYTRQDVVDFLNEHAFFIESWKA